MRILVTGGSGFLGSHVVKALQEKPKYTDILVPRSAEYDLRIPAQVEKLFTNTKPDAVIHLAGRVGGIGANRDHPGEFFYDNLMMGIQTMHEAWKHGTKKFVTIGTICSYPKFAPIPFTETSLWDGYPEETNAPYGLAKKMLLVQAQGYRQQYGFNAIYLLPVNLYGPGDNFHPESSHVIPALIRKFAEAKEANAQSVTLWGDGTPTREFLYAPDAAEAILLALEKYDGADPVNLGTGKDIAIRDLATMIAKEIGFSGAIEWDTSKPNGQPRRCLNVSRAKENFGFEAKTSFPEGLQKTIQWFYEHRKELREVVV